MTEKEYERMEKAFDIKGKLETCDGIICDINDGSLILEGVSLSTNDDGSASAYGLVDAKFINNLEGFCDDLKEFVLEFLQRKRDFFQRQFDEL